MGLWGQNYLRLIRDDARLNLSCCVDLNVSKFEKDLKVKLPQANFFNNYKSIWASKMIDAIIVATSSKDHYEIAKECLLAGKHILIEKPMALSVRHCEELISIADKNKLVLMVGHIFLYNPSVRKIKELIDSDGIGEPLYFYSVRTGLGPIRDDVNALWDLAPHDISILLYWLKERPLSVVARGARYLNDKLDDVVFVNIKFENNKMANIHVSWLDAQKTRKITLVGTNKMLMFDDVSTQEKIRICDKGVGYHQLGANFGEFQMHIRDGDILIPKLPSSEPLKEELNHFIECIFEKRIPLSDGKNGLEVVRLLEAAQQSLGENRIVNL